LLVTIWEIGTQPSLVIGFSSSNALAPHSKKYNVIPVAKMSLSVLGSDPLWTSGAVYAGEDAAPSPDAESPKSPRTTRSPWRDEWECLRNLPPETGTPPWCDPSKVNPLKISPRRFECKPEGPCRTATVDVRLVGGDFYVVFADRAIPEGDARCENRYGGAGAAPRPA
jgi:hypothetical protein